ncbi:MAG: hypothetical protein H0T89_15640 [Deltaproteobacteria bacterium]|nr:hypothetical protein [Deltaproteobacteria bacterium]MDQ3300011.1 hypothetical protein [Myxococcota bacterium]
MYWDKMAVWYSARVLKIETDGTVVIRFDSDGVVSRRNSPAFLCVLVLLCETPIRPRW